MLLKPIDPEKGKKFNMKFKNIAHKATFSRNSLNANVKSVVYCTVLRHSDTEETWRYLWNKYTQTKLATEQVLILNSLGCTRNESLLNE